MTFQTIYPAGKALVTLFHLLQGSENAEKNAGFYAFAGAALVIFPNPGYSIEIDGDMRDWNAIEVAVTDKAGDAHGTGWFSKQGLPKPKKARSDNPGIGFARG
ncbi:hypothetical protein [Thalassomonas sp. RHCl1]|uniref:hypothetical protein n=1 Tax=Thalassomonas sp. RHCl1 TaxID=2995320 RepID=UPI00248CF60E|nr:hypothetical protein [Thalassomonas sp. RHCl1]